MKPLAHVARTPLAQLVWIGSLSNTVPGPTQRGGGPSTDNAGVWVVSIEGRGGVLFVADVVSNGMTYRVRVTGAC
jgi:hypothetical protein